MCGRLFQKVFNDIKSATISLLKNTNLSSTNKTAIKCRRFFNSRLIYIFRKYLFSVNFFFVKFFFVNKENKDILGIKNSLVIKKKICYSSHYS